MNTEVGGMSDAYSVIVNDCDKFTSVLPNVMWRPTNLSSLASASIGAQSIKPSSFGCAIVFSMITTYEILTFEQHFAVKSPDLFIFCFSDMSLQPVCSLATSKVCGVVSVTY